MNNFPYYTLGLCKCSYKAPTSPQHNDAYKGFLWADDSSDMYYYGGCFFWGGIATANYPIVSFYIKQGGSNSELLQFSGEYADGVPVWESSSYRLRYSLVYSGWVLQDKTGQDVPYIPSKSTDTQQYSYAWYFANQINGQEVRFKGFCKAAQGQRTIVRTYAFIETSFLKFEVDSSKAVYQVTDYSNLQFGYKVADIVTSGFDKDVSLTCYIADILDSSLTQAKFVDTETGVIHATILFTQDNKSTLTINSVVLQGGVLDRNGENKFSYKNQNVNYQVTISFTDDTCLGFQRTDCYYGQVAVWH